MRSWQYLLYIKGSKKLYILYDFNLNMIEYIYQILSILLITYLYIHFKKPKIRYLFFGYLTYIFVLIITFPLKYFEYILFQDLSISLLTPLLVGAITIIIIEISKYFTLKRFLYIKNIESAILFSIGWVSIDSLVFLHKYIYNKIIQFLPLELTLDFINKSQFYNLPFFYIFLINLSLTILIVISVIKKKKFFLFLAIFLSLLIYFYLNYFLQEQNLYFNLFLFLISGFILFKSHKYIKL